LKFFFWFLTLALGILLLVACTFLPVPGDPHIPVSIHVASRFMEKGTQETGFSNLTAAVLTDYRSFDLLILSCMGLALGLLAYPLAFPQLGESHKPRISLGFCLIGPWVIVGLGILCMMGGSNLLDYEPLTQWFDPSQARQAGGAIVFLGLGLTLGGGLYLAARALKMFKGAESER
jgi:hypothetical protein